MIFNSFPSMYVHMAADSFVLSAEHQRLVTIVDVCVAAVVIYDYLLTLGDEIELMWTSKSSVTKALYLIQRYLPFIDTVIMIMYTDFTPNRFCHLAITVSGYMYVFSIASSEVILSLRVLATWQRARKVAIGLSISFLLCFLPVFVLMGLFLTTVKFGNSPLPGLGCYTLDGSSILVGCWMLLMLYDAGTMVLMIVAGVSAYKTGGSTALFNAVYRDGILYYIFLFLLSLTNVLVIIVFPVNITGSSSNHY
ncbi:hypothetical protein C8J56DRAFT_982562 [Mycena floridula]|nr:hypothetical protein C8J56DRAFT_982562 [Mycena floridula]